MSEPASGEEIKRLEVAYQAVESKFGLKWNERTPAAKVECLKMFLDGQSSAAGQKQTPIDAAKVKAFLRTKEPSAEEMRRMEDAYQEVVSDPENEWNELPPATKVELVRTFLYVQSSAAGRKHTPIDARKVRAFLHTKAKKSSEVRVRDTEFGIVGTHRIGGGYEMQSLCNEMLKLFKWYDTDGEDRKKFAAPCKPIIQSSGTGKTKMLYDFCASADAPLEEYSRFIISCLKEGFDTTGNRGQNVYCHYFENWGNTEQELYKILGRAMDDLLRSTEKDKVVFVFDEAHNLSNNGGHGLSALRKYLRRKRKQKVVAFIAGTSTSLANCYPSSDACRSSREGVNEEDYHKSGKCLYDPIYELYTMGCYHGRILPKENATALELAAPFGRPLFARLLLLEDDKLDEFPLKATSSITNNDLAIIATRMLLNKTKPFESATPLVNFASVWATRVQLDSTQTSVVDQLVARAYAHLTSFIGVGESEPREMSRPSATFTHMADPVCGYLAMCLMTEGWSLDNSLKRQLQGRSKREWVDKLMELFSSGLCRPPRGDLGELLTAAYLLFCGDQLRFLRDEKNLSVFAVPVVEWVKQLSNPSANPLTEDSKSAPRINFLQFCRNSLHFGMADACNPSFLEHIYKSCCAVYAHESCPMYDATASIESTEDGGRLKYTPILMSIKTRLGSTEESSRKLVDEIVKELYSIKQTHALILVILLDRGVGVDEENDGADKEGAGEGPGSDGDKKRKAESPSTKGAGGSSTWQQVATSSRTKDVNKCTKEIVSRVITIPKNDPFGITDVAGNLTGTQGEADIFSSHSFVGVMDKNQLSGWRKKSKTGISFILSSAPPVQKLSSVWDQKFQEQVSLQEQQVNPPSNDVMDCT